MSLRRQLGNGKDKLKNSFGKFFLKLMGLNPQQLCLVLVGLEGDPEENQFIRNQINTVLSQEQFVNLGRKPGKSWLKDRFFMPYLRDELMDNDIFIETLETATTWGNLNVLYHSVRNAILDTCKKDQIPVVVYTHLSHLYPDGASLYFTIMARQKEADPLGQWVEIKTAANDAIVKANGVISHHHGIGIDHRDHLYKMTSEEHQILKNLKETMDPKGILNPKKLLS